MTSIALDIDKKKDQETTCSKTIVANDELKNCVLDQAFHGDFDYDKLITYLHGFSTCKCYCALRNPICLEYTAVTLERLHF